MNNRIQKEVVRINSIDYLFVYTPSNTPPEVLASFRKAFKDTDLSGRVIVMPTLNDE